MKKKIKKYISKSIVAILLIIIIPSRIVSGTVLDNESNIVEINEMSSNSDEIPENTKIIDNGMEIDDDQEYSDISEEILSVDEALDIVPTDTAIYNKEKKILITKLKRKKLNLRKM